MRIRDNWAVLRLQVENDARAHWDTLGSMLLLDIVLVLSEHLLDIVVKIKLDLLVSLLNLHAKERLHKPATSDLEILGVLAHKLFLELSAGRDMHVEFEQLIP